MRGTASYPTATSSADRSTLQVSFNASTGAYTLNSGSVSQTFSPSHRDAALSAGDGEVYVRTSGSTTDSLFLTRNAEDPGTPDNPQFRYVGAGAWQRTTTTSTTASGFIEAFAYGVETPSASVPVTGSANYLVRLYGVSTLPSQLQATRGDGSLAVDFAAGTLTGGGNLYNYSIGYQTGGENWSANATISASDKSFNGIFVVPNYNTGTGSLEGRFYGPAADELGASYYFKATGGPTYVGAIIGKDSSLFPSNETLRAMIVNEDLADAGVEYFTSIEDVSGINYFGGEPNPHSSDQTNLVYSEDSGSFIYSAGISETTLPTARTAALSNAAFDGYSFTTTRLVNGNPVDEEHTAFVLRPADDNPELVLTYSSLLAYKYRTLDRLTYYDVREGYVGFGQLTPADAIPRTGQGTYGALLYGQSDNTQFSDGSSGSYDVVGTGEFVMDFGTGTVGGSLSPWLYDPIANTLTELGRFTLDSGTITYGSGTLFDEPGFYGAITSPTPFLYSSGTFSGEFTGPNAEEIVARWLTVTEDPVSGNKLDIFGAAVGKLGASGLSVPDLLPGATPRPDPIPVPAPSLPDGTTSLVNANGRYGFAPRAASLSTQIDANGEGKRLPATGDQRISVVFDSASGNYEVRVGASNEIFAPASEQAALAVDNMNYTLLRNGTGSDSRSLIISDVPVTPDQNLTYVTHGLFTSLGPNALSSNTNFDAYGFYAGIPTGDLEVPRIGSANYSVYLYAVGSAAGQPTELIRSLVPGTMDVHFQGDSLSLTGTAQSTDYVTGAVLGSVDYQGSADIASFANAFSGNFTLDAVAGTWEGQFFGPNAQEVGATFHSNDGALGFAGSLAGSRNAAFTGNAADFTTLDAITDFGAIQLSSMQNFYSFSTEIHQLSTSLNHAMENPTVTPVSYDPANGGTWTFREEASFAAGDIDPANTDDSFTAYGDVTLGATGVDPVNGARVLKPGAGNSLIELSYTSFATYEVGDGQVDRYYYVFGFETPDVDVPTTGSASYTAIVRGFGNSIGQSGDKFYTVDGSAHISVDFGISSWIGTVSLSGTDMNGGGSRDFGSFTGDTGSISGNHLRQVYIHDGANQDIGDMFAYLFGPNAEEIGGGVKLYLPDPDITDNQLGLRGVFFGDKD